MSKYEEYQEALNKMCNRCFGDEPRKVLQELVNNETAKRPKSKRLYYNCHNGECDKTLIHYCPICNFSSVEKDYANYCPKCGQKLDWSDKDE